MGVKSTMADRVKWTMKALALAAGAALPSAGAYLAHTWWKIPFPWMELGAGGLMIVAVIVAYCLFTLRMVRPLKGLLDALETKSAQPSLKPFMRRGGRTIRKLAEAMDGFVGRQRSVIDMIRSCDADLVKAEKTQLDICISLSRTIDDCQKEIRSGAVINDEIGANSNSMYPL
jgi:hypothetical protein